ncbi:mitogen-activated protein kinase kinase kinase anp1 [Phtheirospermum japonicum]|uniref:Mitogen-activated protein kinase kinase kinase anp1 n=1 Tax=Phtheirospermum japonicum TaxID=374723 RepID=A0A830C6Z1_9LAMI|nr:mitogen-activated protein kinase kinase kinase anp1 [Phtheirospermum japonicum]
MVTKREIVFQQKAVNVNEYGDGVAWIRGPILGRGSFGSVYKATLKNQYHFLPSEFAVKSADVSVSSSLRHEKESMSHLKGCPYVIQCFGEETTIGDDGVTGYNLLLEYGSGGTLADRIKKLQRLPEGEVRAHTRSILRGLSHIHGLGYVHCDLKPGIRCWCRVVEEEGLQQKLVILVWQRRKQKSLTIRRES